MRYYPVNIPSGAHRTNEKMSSARSKNIEGSDQKSTAKKGQQPIKAYTVENVDMYQNSEEKTGDQYNDLLIDETEES